MPSANDVYITPASRKIQWYNSSADVGSIFHDATNFYVSGAIDLKLKAVDDITLEAVGGGGIVKIETGGTERLRFETDYGFILYAGTPSTTTNVLYNVGGSLYFNGSAVGGGTIGGSVSDTYIPIATAADTLGNFMPAYVENTNMIMGVTPTSITTDADGNTAYGHLAGQALTDGDNNVFMGYRAGISVTTGVANVFLGQAAGYGATTSSYNNFIGYQTAYVGTRGNQNQAMGYYAMATNQGANNIAIGHNTMEGEVGADNDNTVAIGSYALRNISGSASDNVAIGASAMQGASTGITSAGQYNVAIGSSSMAGLTSGYSNVAVGRQALADTSSGYGNVALGYLAGKGVTTGYNNIFIGLQAGQYNAGGSANTIVGYLAGRNNTGHYNTILGYDAGITQTSSNRNTFLGYGAGKDYVQTGDNKNTAVGMYAMTDIQSGSSNTAMGYQALAGVNGSNNDFNTAVGYQALFATNGGDNNTAVGFEAGYGVTTGHSHVIVGFRGARSMSGGERNIYIGSEVGYMATDGSSNTVIGNQASYHISGASNVTSLGRNAGYFLSGSNNTFLGMGAARGVSTGGNSIDNVAIGATAGYYFSTANYNVAVGNGALAGPAAGMTGDNNVVVGREAMNSTTSGYETVAIGAGAGFNVTTANRNVYIGYQSGYAQVASAEYSVMIGQEAGYDVSGQRNLMIGGGAGHNAKVDTAESTYVGYNAGANASGATNTFVGASAGISTNTGTGLTAIGSGAMKTITGSYNTAIGWGAMADGAGDAASNIAVGYRAMQALTTGDRNVGIGSYGLAAVTTHNDNTTVGDEAGKQVNSSNNTIIGSRAGEKLDEDTNGAGSNTIVGAWAGRGDNGTFSGGYNVIMGAYAMNSNALSTARDNVAIGYKAASGATSMVDNVIIGDRAGMSSTTASYSTFVGHEAGYDVTTGAENTYIGYHAGRVNATANYNVFMGNGAGEFATGVASSVIIGRQAMGGAAATGDGNVALGHRAGYSHTTGDDNVFIGVSAGNASTTAAGNVVIGKDALKGSQDSSTGGSNSILGTQAATGTTGMRNAMVGFRAGFAATSADSNVYIGYEAGAKITTGDYNVCLGQKSGPSSTSTESSKLYIHNDEGTPLIGGDFSSDYVDINGNLNTHNIRPLADNTYALGTPGLSWTELHLEDYIELNAASATTNHAGTNRFWVSGTTPFFNNQVIQVGAGDPLSIAAGRFSQGAASQAGILMSDYGAATNSASNAGTVTYLYWDNNTSTLHPRNLSMGGTFTMGGHGMDDILISSDSASTSNTALVTAGYVNANAGGGSPGGSDTQVQFNDGGSFGGSANFTWDDSQLKLIGTSSKTLTLDPYWVVPSDNQFSLIHANDGLALSADDANIDLWASDGRKVRVRQRGSGDAYDGTANTILEIYKTGSTSTGGPWGSIIRAPSGSLYLATVGAYNMTFDCANTLTTFFDTEYNIYSAADGNSRFTIREASTAAIEFEGDSDIQFKNGTTALMKIAAGGNVGIGTTTPGEKLHVQGNGRFTGKLAVGSTTAPTNNGISVSDTLQIAEKASAPTHTAGWGTIWVSGSAPNTLWFRDDDGGNVQLGAGGAGGANLTLSNLDAGTAINSSLVSDADNTDDLGSSSVSWRKVYTKEYNGFDTNIAQWAAGVSANADIHYSIGPQALITSISAAGGIVTGIQTQQAPSDSKVKDNVKKYTTGLSLIDKLEPKTWNWNDSKYGDTTKTNYGLMADDVEAINSSFTKVHSTHETHGEIKGFSEEFTNQYNMALLQAVKDLSAKNDALEARIVELEGKL